jgi:hypothetical protein
MMLNGMALKAAEIAQNIFEIQLKLPQNGKTIKKTLLLSDEQKHLASIFGFGG